MIGRIIKFIQIIILFFSGDRNMDEAKFCGRVMHKRATLRVLAKYSV